jgi:DNA-binding transcriptional MerR regulator
VSKKLKMKDLERATGVGREAIRFYIREGLLPSPERPARNVAWYDESFVERILLVKKLQTERYLPLSVIKSIVAGEDVPARAEVETLLDLDRSLPAAVRDHGARPPERLSALAKRVGMTSKEILSIAKTEAVAIVTRDGDQWLEGRDVAIVELWARARAAGFTDDVGFSAETLRKYVEFSRWLVREELRQFASNVTGKADRTRVQRMAEVGIANSGEILRLVHERVMLDAIARGNIPPSAATTDDAEAAND